VVSDPIDPDRADVSCRLRPAVGLADLVEQHGLSDGFTGADPGHT
jgi:hypothetical protein